MKKDHNLLKHMFHMILRCGLPIVILSFLPLIIKFSPSIGNIIGKIVPFLCPIMMISMVLMMSRGSGKENCCDNSNKDHNKKSIEINNPNK
ncbi:hypothetical protein [Sporanaerobacter sp. PP17-6a]|uniref:hypothetical protein n=1 Tax=Sporanaerobacter sp. PP17-6a TaxID=1891289 RepID=UPI00089F93D8|nr:hypothetical protein [Sporanaerobacter sp. PP17-6a]SCL93017.1 hypothetical protein PP176A_2407 [Sporanaerobacter sp. PP17-6a]